MHILADVGGTKMRVAATEDAKSFGDPVVLDTPKEYAQGIAAISEAARGIGEIGRASCRERVCQYV